jgi:hypothetical protein
MPTWAVRIYKEMLRRLKGNDRSAELATFLGETAAAIDDRIC